MEISLVEPGQLYKPTVIALGNFDGVHLGHQALLKSALDKAQSLGVGVSVLLFDPHPLKQLYPERKLNLLTGREERLALFEEMGVERVFLFPFTLEFAQTTPEKFVDEILLKLGAVHVIVGFNYSFGCQGRGNPKDLVDFGSIYGFGVSIIQAQKVGSKVISSTEIRKYLLNGDIKMAKKMIGRSPKLSGKVVHGDKRGRELGFPTANLEIDEDLLIPKNGVYAVQTLIKGHIYGGMMNIGIRPTFTDQQKRTIEIYFFDYQGDLYGQKLLVSIEARLRAERKFDSPEEIVSQLYKDQDEARAILSPLTEGSYLI